MIVAAAAQAGFLAGGGALGELIADYPWEATTLGPIAGWPQSLRTIVTTILHSKVPVVTLWHEDGYMIYNDAYAAFAGVRHPDLLGARVREGWPEVAGFNDQVMRTCLGGGTLAFREQELTLWRAGQPERLFLDLDYSPLFDEGQRVAGVMSVVRDVTTLVQAQRAVLDERERLRELFDQSPSFMSVKRGPEHRFELTNQAYCTLTGRHDLVGRALLDALPELRGQPLLDLLDRAYHSGEVQRATAHPVEVQRGEGATETRYLDLVYQPMRDGAGDITGVFAEGNDVTDRVLAERAARASDLNFLTVTQVMPNHVWTARPDGVVDWANVRALEYSGFWPDKPLEDWITRVHPDDVARASAAWSAALASGEPYQVEFRILRHDGAYLWHLVRALPVCDATGAVLRWIGTNTDIDDRKQAETETARDLARVWALSPVLKIVASQAEGRMLAVNPAWTRVLGYSEAETIGRHVSDFVAPEDMENAQAGLAGLVAGRTAVDHAIWSLAKDGQRRLISWNTVPERGMLYGFGRDVTEQRLVEDALRQSQKMEAVGQLTGGIAHDFNNLLQGITGSLDLLQKRIAQRRYDDVERFIAGATGAANRATALTHRLLAFSRRQPLDPRPVRANPLIESMEELLRRTMGERIELSLALHEALWLTLCDPNQLENAILNLAINARDAMPDGGRLTIETDHAQLDDAFAAWTRDVRPGQYVCICVSDTGAGMDSDTMDRAFEPFFTTKPLGQGTGLGLSMIYGFARQSEGYVKIFSEIGRGTTVKLYLPRYRGEDEADAPAAPLAAAPEAAGETVLVVEDEPVVRGLIVEVLSDLGYAALEAVDGPAGLALLQSKHRIDLLITDIGLPGLNGRQVADAGRLLRPGLKILFMTGYAENASLAAGFLEPGMAMITKPFAMEVLGAKVRKIIEG